MVVCLIDDADRRELNGLLFLDKLCNMHFKISKEL